MKKKVLVFPCGSEIGLEIHRCLRNSKHFELYGASSVEDHGRFVYENVFEVPHVDAPDFLETLDFICKARGIDFVIPAHDDVIVALAGTKLASKLITPATDVCRVCRSKSAIYNLFPEISPGYSDGYPAFIKPDRGQGSNGAKVVYNNQQVLDHREEFKDIVVCEYLPGPEFTVDCFTDKFGRLRFCEGRSRERIKDGISCRTRRVERPEFRQFAEKIGERLEMRGAWFFQVKERADGELKLLEIAPRIAGSSGLWRAYGVNLIETALFDFMLDTEIPERRFRIDAGIRVVMSRALDTVFKGG